MIRVLELKLLVTHNQSQVIKLLLTCHQEYQICSPELALGHLISSLVIASLIPHTHTHTHPIPNAKMYLHTEEEEGGGG